MELLSLFHDEYIRSDEVMERKSPVPGDLCVITVFACIFCDDKMLIQQRQSTKAGWPSMWDVSSGGATASGESSREAVVRETREELGIVLASEQFVKIFSIYHDNHIHDIFTVKVESEDWDFNVPNDEVMNVKWASEQEILDMIDAGTFIPVYKEFIGLLFKMKAQKGIITA